MDNRKNRERFLEIYPPGTIVPVIITHIIKPSQIITSFNGDFIGRLSVLDIAKCLPTSEKKFQTYKVGDSITCVILEIDFKSKEIKLSQKYIPDEEEAITWEKVLLNDEFGVKFVAELNNSYLVKTESDLYGILPKDIEKNLIEETSVRVRDKIENCYLLSFISTNAEIEIFESADLVLKNEFEYIDEDLRSYRAFYTSLLGRYATPADDILIKRGFDADETIFSKEIFLDQTIYLEFQINSQAYENDFKNRALPHFFRDLQFDEESERKLLNRLSTLKYWFKLNKFIDNKHGKDDVESTSFTLFNEEVSILVNVNNTKDQLNPRFIIKNLSIGNDWSKTIEKKKRHSKNGAFLFTSNISVKSPYSSLPNGLSQKEPLDYLVLKTDCFNSISRIKKESGEILRQEGHTLSIIDKFLEYQISQLYEQKEGEIFVEKFEQISSDTEGIAIKFNVIFDEENINLEGDPVVNVRIKQPSLKEDQEEELVRVGDGTLKQMHDGYKISFNREIEIGSLEKGFYLDKKVSKKQYTIQREIIKDFLEKKIKINHIESLLIKPEKIKKPKVAKIEFNNADLDKAAKANSDNNQVMAVKKAVGNQNIFLIQGPPGTGKTTVIAEIIDQLTLRGQKILVAGQNHVAVDNVLEKISKNPKLALLRVGNRDRVAPEFVRYCIDNLIEDYKIDFKKFIKNQAVLTKRFLKFKNQDLLDDEITRLYSEEVNKVSEKYGHLKERYRHKHFNLKASLSELTNKNIEKSIGILENWSANIQNEYEVLLKPFVYNTVDVVFATCIGIKTDTMFKELTRKFDVIIIDEAGKANIAESLVAMELGKKVILVGDQMQLPPYIDSLLIDEKNPECFQKSQFGKDFKMEDIFHALKTSFFEFIINRIDKGQFPKENLELLNYQHRMHPNIGEFVSSSFYDGKVQMGAKTGQNRLNLPVPLNKEIIFFDTSNSDSSYEQAAPPSIKNNYEAKAIAEYILPLLFDNDISPLNIAIIAPYKAQVSNIQNHINRSTSCVYKQIDVSTLDSFQGKEFDIIIFSFTRSSDHRKAQVIDGYKKFTKVGFLDDARRLNVAFSRAKKKLILIGNAKYLSDSRSHFDQLFDYTALFRKLIDLSKKEKIGNFLSIADSLTKEKKALPKLKQGDLFFGVINEKAISKNNNKEYGKYIKTDAGQLIAPYQNKPHIINRDILKQNIGNQVKGIVVGFDKPKNIMIAQILDDLWFEIAEYQKTQSKITVFVSEINWFEIKVTCKSGLTGTIKIFEFSTTNKPSKNEELSVMVENFNYIEKTIDFKL